MSNRVTLQATEFINHPQNTKTYGYRIYDDYAQAYDNTFDTLVTDDLELLKHALESRDENVVAMLDFIREQQRGITINGDYYVWDEIKQLWEEIECPYQS